MALHKKVVSMPSAGSVILLDFSYAQMRKDLHITSDRGTEVTKNINKQFTTKGLPFQFCMGITQNPGSYSRLPAYFQHKEPVMNCSHN